MKRIILNIIGFAALFCGIIGLALPVWPTTPFIMAAAGCFGAANPAMYRRLARSKYFGEYVRNYREKTGISKAARNRGLVFLWTTLIISGVITRHIHVLIVLAVVGTAVTVHLMTMKVKTSD